MKRYGPLIAVDGALVVGDPGRHHLRLTPDAVALRDGQDDVESYTWAEIDGVTLYVPTTRFRLPGLASTVALSVVAALVPGTLDIDPDDAAVELVVAGESVTLPLSRHHVGGYWAPTVEGAHRLIGDLIRTPEQRALLTQPEHLVDLAAKLARSIPEHDG